MRDSGMMIATLDRRFRKLAINAKRRSPKTCTVFQNPIVVAGWQQIALIEPRSALQVSRCDGVTETQDIDRTRTRRAPLDSPGFKLNKFFSRR